MNNKQRDKLIAFGLMAMLAIPGAVLAGGSPTDSTAYRNAAGSRSAEDPNLVWTASSVALLAEQVAPGVYAFYPDTAHTKNDAGYPEATSGGFIVGDNGVLVVDTMLNRWLANQVLALVAETTDKPIRYIVNTSYHGDHSYGNQFFPEETTIIQHRATRDYIRDYFAEDIAFMEANFGTEQGLDELSPVMADVLLEDGVDMSVDLGGIKVRIRHLGFAQTHGDLFVTTAEGSVAFTGNPVIAKAPALPWLLDGRIQASTATMKALRALLPDDAIVVPGHGAPTNVAAIDHHITYLEDLKAEVQKVIDAGISKEAAGEAATMPEYAGYALHPWVHVQVNVPAAYDELTQN
jgi:glyoxylase-like metal-dependent hydrolase (beta-lactamase superfamily II)